MEHTRTTPKQSVILKKIGYDVPTTKFYTVSSGKNMYTRDKFNYNLRELAMSAPKLVDVATWLRTVRNLHVYVRVMERYWCYNVQDAVSGKFRANSHYYYDTHDLALSAGIDFVLTKLNEDA
jgi:hypothetical protein